jgi:hypothetical protein
MTTLPVLRLAACAACLVVAPSALRAAPAGPPAKHLPPPPGLPDEEPGEPVTFLGIETTPAGPTLDDQLGLPADTGLVVMSVVPDSPAAAVLKPHDVLTRLDDQILIDTRQLAVLVRTHRAGEEIALTYVRGGKTVTVRVKLVERTLPRMFRLRFPGPGLGRGENRLFHLQTDGGPGEPMLPSMEEAPGLHAVRVFRRDRAGGVGGTAVKPADSRMLLTDDKGSLDVAIKSGSRTLVAKDPQGKTLFDGPVDTPEQRKAMPPGVRERFEQMETMDTVTFDAAPESRPAPGPGPLPETDLLPTGGPL